MTMHIANGQGEPSAGGGTPCLVMTSVEQSRLPQIREALSAIRTDSITVFPVATWSRGRELTYRGARCHVDDVVFRIEIVCTDDVVRWVVGAMRKVLEKEGAPGGATSNVVVLPLALT